MQHDMLAHEPQLSSLIACNPFACAAPTSAFEAMAAASRVPLLEEQQRVAEQLAAEAKAALKAREQQLEAAANEFEAAVAKAKELEEAAEVARAQAGLERKKQKTAEADAEPTWSLAKWNELETKEQTRRAVEIDESKTDRALPPGNETRGWHRHWHRGVFGKKFDRGHTHSHILDAIFQGNW